VFKNYLGDFKEKPLNQITRADVRELIYSKLKAGLAANMLAHIKAFVSGILTHAMEEELIQANPASRTGKLIKTKERKAEISPLSREEAQAFLTTMGVGLPPPGTPSIRPETFDF
jgi:hypothetical protein